MRAPCRQRSTSRRMGCMAARLKIGTIRSDLAHPLDLGTTACAQLLTQPVSVNQEPVDPAENELICDLGVKRRSGAPLGALGVVVAVRLADVASGSGPVLPQPTVRLRAHR